MGKSIFEVMEEKQIAVGNGTVYYWVSYGGFKTTLFFLHGLTADHTLFEKQIPAFIKRYNIICWDTPAHGKSRPFDFTYALAAQCIKAILDKEQIKEPVFVGQSMGGFLVQAFMKRYPQMATAFIGIDTCPFGLDYYSKADCWWLRQIEWMSMCFPEKLLRKALAKSCTRTRDAYESYFASLRPYSKKELCHLMGVVYAGFLKENCDLEITCPTLILVGQYDRTGKVKQYCREWAKRTGFPLQIIPNAAHNANYDNSKSVNEIIELFLQKIDKNGGKDDSL